MKNIYAAQLEDELYITEEHEELLYEKWLKKLKEQEEQEAKKRRELWKRFFFGNTCYAHDRDFCRECRMHGLGICPSTREESTLPYDF